MLFDDKLNFGSQMPQDSRGATKYIVEALLDNIHPFILKLRKKIDFNCDEDEVTKIRDVFGLCCNQIKKCILGLFDVFRLEHKQGIILLESRQCNLERLQWCINKLIAINNNHDDTSNVLEQDNTADDSINATVMYFVNWIDHTFEVLSKLAGAIYKTDYKESEEVCDLWKNGMVECVSELHISIDELLLSAMTLCRYCLPGDQHIVKARCQVVLRETKALLSELVESDLSTAVKASPDTLKWPIMPSNVNVLIDVLKDVLYALETNTNTALLALLIRCFSNNMSPIDVLKEHFSKSAKGTCTCVKNDYDETVDCAFVKEFDVYNERLLQIGSFAVSCSSDQNRILSLRSGLASLEALDPHLVPAVMMSPDSHHSILLTNSWRQEVQDIRDNVFLIVDPAAFAEKSKQMMHQKLLEVLRDTEYKNTSVCSVINIGCVVHDFFEVYDNYEPDALTQYEKLVPLLNDLKKVRRECKVVSNLLATNEDFIYNVKMPNNKNASMDQLAKRLKLLYSIVNKINALLHPKENDDQLFDYEGGDDDQCKNVTHTVYRNSDTYDVNSPRKPPNLTRSIFARTTNVRSSTRNVPLSKLTKHLRSKKCNELSFSVQLDRLFNALEDDDKQNGTFYVNKHLVCLRERSILYNFSPIKNRSSLRKAVLNRHCISRDKVLEGTGGEESVISEKESLMDEAMSLQITDALNQMNDITSILSTTQQLLYTSTYGMTANEERIGNSSTESQNILKLHVNNPNTTISTRVWNIPVNASFVEMPLDNSECTSNITQPSNVTTLERINDLDLVESKLNSLKSQLETSL